MSDIQTILFDLDGTLLPLDQDVFIQAYFELLAKTLSPRYPADRLMPAMRKGVEAMFYNDGKVTNESVFWNTFCAVYGEDVTKDLTAFDAFYRKEFQALKAVCGYQPKAAETVGRLKEAGFRVALATNPVFPSVATEARIRWAGLEPSDFAYVTTYENASFAKPHPAYYRRVAAALNCPPEHCLMVGNDVVDDMEAERVGMKVFLLTDTLLNREGKDITRYPRGSYDALLSYLEML